MSHSSGTTTGLVSHWIERVNAGDPAARNELLRHAQHRLDVCVHRMLRRFPNVVERTSDVLIGVMVRMDRTVQQIKLATSRDYFNLAARHIRLELLDIARQRRQAALTPEEADRVPAPGDEPELLSRWAEVHAWIEALPEEERELWNLLWYNELTQQEAAAILEMTRTTLRRRWRETRVSFMERFGQDRDIFLQ